MERIDKIISSQTQYSRSEVRTLILKKKIVVNGETISKYDKKYDEENINIEIEGQKIELKKYIYLVLNKPMGYISATEDKEHQTVLDLIPDRYKDRGIFPAGRLDKDTTGLMILTNDGVFSHNILSPRKHVKKVYEVMLDIDMTREMVDGFYVGVQLNDGECKSAELVITGKNTGVVTIREGRYHQIKRMFGCFGGKVIKLNRIRNW